MNITELQLKLHKAIDTITDPDKLAAIHTLLKGSKGPFESMTLTAYVEAIDKARQQIKDGEYLTTEELEKESENW